MTFAALQKWGRTLPTMPTSPVFSCHIEVQVGGILIKQFRWNCWRNGRMKASTEVAMVDHQEFHLPAWPIRSMWWASQEIFLEEKTTLTRTWFEKGFNWKLSSRLKKVGKSEDAWSPLFPLHGSFPWQSGGPGDRERPTWKATTPTPSPQYPSQNAPTPNPISHILFPALHRLYCNVSEGHHKLPQYRDICVFQWSFIRQWCSVADLVCTYIMPPKDVIKRKSLNTT